MSLLDFVPHDDGKIEAQQEVRLKLRFPPGKALLFFLVALLVVGLCLVTAMTLTDPSFHLKNRPGVHLHGRGRALILLLLSLPLAIRALLLWSLTGTTTLALIVRARRIADQRVDYVIGQHGVTDIGMFGVRHLDWDEVRRVVLFEQRRRSVWFRDRKTGMIFAEFDTGVDPNVYGAIQRTSYNLFIRKRIAIPLSFVAIEPIEMKRIVRRFKPAMPITEETRYYG